MKRSQVLREKLETAVLEQERLLDLAEKEGQRDFTKGDDGEEAQFNALDIEIKQYEVEIKKAEQRENAEERIGRLKRDTKETPEQKEIKENQREFSLFRTINAVSNGRSLTGREAEVVEEGKAEARSNGLATSGHIVLPSWMMGRTTLTAATAATAGNLVATDLYGLIPTLRPKLLVESLGAKMWGGLVGDIDIPRRTTDLSMTFEGENDTAAESNPIYDKLQLSPNRLGGYTDISRQLLVQSSVDVENDVREQISFAIKKAMDTAAINGASTGDDPTGILNTTGIGSVVGGTNGAVPTWADIIDLETAVAVDNADYGKLAYLMTPGLRGLFKQTPRVSGTEGMIWENNNDMLNGYRVGVSTQVPSTLTKGTSSVCHGLIFGDFSQMIVGNWGGVDIILDEVTQATSAKIRIHVFSWWDIVIRHAESFAAMKDALLS